MSSGTGMLGGESFPGILIDAAHFAQVTRYTHVASYLVVLYDWFLCLDEETKLVFTEGVSRAKVAYAFCRYWPILTYPVILWVQGIDHDRSVCEKIFRIPMLIAIPNVSSWHFPSTFRGSEADVNRATTKFASAASILILRIYAFTGANRFVALFLMATFLGVIGYQAWVGAVEAVLIPMGNGCYPVNGSNEKWLSGYFIAALLWDCIATLVFLVYALKMKMKWADTSKMTRIFIREGAGYFLAISIINIINGAFNLGPTVLMSGTMVPMGMLLPNILACRLVINLRRKGAASDLPSSIQVASTNMGFHARKDMRKEDITLASFVQSVPKDVDSPSVASPAVTSRTAWSPMGLPQHRPWISDERSYFQPGLAH
ncbi:hypothetical protein EXIGLDRAFT_842940 [Exidia glandulosa HHB12029]|uniref:DUF6533 domain-containing protein n=1 Tax=Exidia glandulosa HHB12029 TaxID=1314781 RepID=A0A165CYV0_EXIGL|nr:hypothetical protein EXIGLDRAFT_842940 [Exidia glandulosa HHB12029]